MSTKHVVTAGVVLGSLAAAADAASVTLFTDSRSVETSAWTGDPVEPVQVEERADAAPGQVFDQVLNTDVVSPDASTVITAQARQTSALDFAPEGGFEFTGSMQAGSSTFFEPADGGPVVPDGFGYPTSVFDIVIDTDSAIEWELVLEMETAGDAAANFTAFDFAYSIMPLQSETQSFALTGEIEAGRYRITADVVAPTDPFFNGSTAKVNFTLRGAVATPIPTAFASAGALLAATLLRRRRR